jgi:hypothetical protein
MFRQDIIIGEEYGYREKPFQKGPMERVRIVDRVRSQWKVEWIEPNSGLQDFVRSNHLVIPWKERKAFLDDEASWGALQDRCDSCWPGFEHPLSDAVDTVLESTGEMISIGKYGALSCEPEVLERVIRRASCELPIQRPGFIDRFGVAHLPFDSAVRLAQAFAVAEPRTVLLQADTEEQDYDLKANELGNSYLVPIVQQRRAGWALCRQWAGFDQAIAQREQEIQRLRRIIEDIRYELRRAGQDDLAAEVDRKLHRR